MNGLLFWKKKAQYKPPVRRWEIDSARLSDYHDLLQSSDKVDERTWSDLEMAKTFQQLDRSLTPCGSQYLFCRLKNYPEAEDAKELANSVGLLVANREISRELGKALDGLNCRESADLGEFLHRKSDSVPSGHWIFYSLFALTIGLTIGSFSLHWLFLPLVGLWATNVWINLRFGSLLAQDAPALSALLRMVDTVRKLQALDHLQLPELAKLKDFSGAVEQISRKTRWVALRPLNGNDLELAALEYLNMFCLFEVTFAVRSAVAIRKHRAALVQIFETIARLDAIRGLAESLPEYPSWCPAEQKGDRTFCFESVIHPLVANATPNSVQVEGSLLILGTNMAGKTTFIKTVAINLLLSQTIGICLARKARVAPMRVKTLIKRDDTVTVGQSYFFGEAKELLTIMQEAEESRRTYLLVVDEIFRGTNTTERIAAGKAVLSHLTQRMTVMATTHDSELSSLLHNEFESGHFAEKVTDSGIEFDYIFKKGPCASRNAIKLLAMAGYPAEVIGAAEAAIGAIKGDPVVAVGTPV